MMGNLSTPQVLGVIMMATAAVLSFFLGLTASSVWGHDNKKDGKNGKEASRNS